MARKPIAEMSFSKVYPLLVQKAERKGRTRAEVDAVCCWLTGHDEVGLARQLERGVTYRELFDEAPARSAAWMWPPSRTRWSRTPATWTSSSTSSPAGARWRRCCGGRRRPRHWRAALRTARSSRCRRALLGASFSARPSRRPALMSAGKECRL